KRRSRRRKQGRKLPRGARSAQNSYVGSLTSHIARATVAQTMKEVSMEKRSVATLRDRGQLTIPADVRKQAQLEEGAVVEFEVREEGLLLRPKIVLDDVHLDEGFIRSVIDATATAYADLRADEEAWAEELAERAVL